ncbi:MAG TPA: type II secretion system F family protein, partial [Chthonomonadaceae bacterium]|nr:type II secretion system F family protein [Chthonomonadaceae bacterium]
AQSTGVIAAKDSAEVREVLRNKDLFVTTLREQAAPTGAAAGFQLFKPRKVKLAELVVMSRQMATLVRSGISIVECLHAVHAQTENPILKQAVNQIRLDVLTGSTLTDAMRKHSRILNEMYVSLVQAGETGGVLERTLEIAAVQFDQEAELQEKVKAAFVYPTIVLVASVGVVFFMLIFIVPVFAKVYEQFHAVLPPVTLLLVVLSNMLLSYWWLAAIIGYAAQFGFKRYIRTPTGRAVFDKMMLKMPLLGPLNRKIAVARFTQTFAGATKAGVPILRALSISAQTSGNVVIMEAIKKVAGFVKDGSTLTVPLEQTGEFPPMVTRMIAAGEQSGNLDTMLEEITHFYNRDIEYTVNKLTKIMEPAMTVVVGGIVLFVLLALYMPIFNLTNVVKSH